MKNNRLKASQEFKLCIWLDEHYDSLEITKPDYEKLAKLAASALGMPVTRSNMIKTFRAIGRPYWNSRPRGGSRHNLVSRDTLVMMGAIRVLYKDLNATMPQDFASLLDHYETIFRNNGEDLQSQKRSLTAELFKAISDD